MNKLPVFVFPISLEFYLAARHTHKQLLTLYNPCDFAVNFQVMCTSPHKFTVTDPEGVIPALSCVDVAMRYTHPSTVHCNSTDKFRITMHDRVTNQVLGKRIVVAKFLPGEPEGPGPESPEDRAESFQPLVGRTAAPPPCTHPSHRSGSPSGLVLVVCSLCVIALLLPSAPAPPARPTHSLLPAQLQERLQLSPNLQLVCSFVLGLLTMVLLRP